MESTQNETTAVVGKATSKDDSFDNIIQKYQAEMLKYKSVKQPIQQEATKPKDLHPPPITSPKSVKVSPPIIVQPPTLVVPQPKPIQQESDTTVPLSQLDDTGYIQIEVVAAGQAYPIPQAVVTITKVANGVTILNKIVQTDQNGKAPMVKVPAPSRELSQQPSELIPYATYSITVESPFFQSVESRNIQVFGGTVAMQIIEMIPLMEWEKPNDTNVVYNTPEHSLVEE